MFDNKKIHLIGIGGISMSGIAKILHAKGCEITGYDLKKSELTQSMEDEGIQISYEYNLANVDNADIVVYTAAIKDDNEELAHAKATGKELYERSVFFGMMMKDYKNVLCISGTHGKSTTSGMVSTIFVKCEMDPTIQIGAMLPLIGGNERVGSNEYFIAEACEYVDSFLSFFPTAEIILNIDNDHLDYFGTLDNILASFTRYTRLLPDGGILVVNNDDENALRACAKSEKKITYGIKNTANYMAKEIGFNDLGHPYYDLYVNNEKKAHVQLAVSGEHNVSNSLAAIALSHQYISDINRIVKALETFTGVGRRFEYLGKYNEANIFDDYAHHPSEIKTTLESAIKTKHNKIWAIFQSHTFSRTKDHLKEFGEVLARFENVIIAPIYPAREENIYGVSEDQLVDLIKQNGNDNVLYLDSFAKIEIYLKENIKPNDLVVTIGAGPINEVAKNLVK